MGLRGGILGNSLKLYALKDKAECREIGRSERIRTSDPLLPKQVRYQTALRSDRGAGLNPLPRFGKAPHA